MFYLEGMAERGGGAPEDVVGVTAVAPIERPLLAGIGDELALAEEKCGGGSTGQVFPGGFRRGSGELGSKAAAGC